MIIDTLQNANIYFPLSDDIRKGLEFLQSASLEIQVGTYEVSKKAKVLVTEYDTKVDNPNRFESHRRVIDIQYPIVGLEAIEWSPLNGMNRVTEYDEAKDIQFHDKPVNRLNLVIGNGMFAIFFPDDAHNPALAASRVSQRIKKATVKVIID